MRVFSEFAPECCVPSVVVPYDPQCQHVCMQAMRSTGCLKRFPSVGLLSVPPCAATLDRRAHTLDWTFALACVEKCVGLSRTSPIALLAPLCDLRCVRLGAVSTKTERLTMSPGAALSVGTGGGRAGGREVGARRLTASGRPAAERCAGPACGTGTSCGRLPPPICPSCQAGGKPNLGRPRICLGRPGATVYT